MINRFQENRNRGTREAVDFKKIQVGMKTLEDAIMELSSFRGTNTQFADKKAIFRAMQDGDYAFLKEVSNFYYRTSGIYARLVRYLACLYRYDWYVTPFANQDKADKLDAILKKYDAVLTFLDNFNAKKFFGEVSLKVILNGCYYGYKIQKGNKVGVQELPIEYCRTRYSVGNRPVVEFNMRYFDVAFRDVNQRIRALQVFPPEFAKGYKLYKEGKIPPERPGDTACWYVLEPENTIKFNLNNDDFPIFVQVIPALIDLNEAQELDRRKMAQKLLKIIIQKMPVDKNGDLVFDVDEAQALHNNAVSMLGRAIGVDVLTTFADVEVADLADRSTVTSVDELEKIERAVFNEAGVAESLFNTDGNIALEKSILNDEATIYNLILQYQDFLNDLIEPFNNQPKLVSFTVEILNTTIYNYKDLAKLYQEQTKLGYSKMLPQVALGYSQRAILATAYFENELLQLSTLFVPPMSSNTMSSDALREKGEAGRKEKPDDEKSEKTIQNIESMN